MTMRFTLTECVTYQRAVRLAIRAEAGGLSVMDAYELAEQMLNSRDGGPGRPPGTYVNHRNEVRPIVAPRRESEPARKMRSASIASLCAVEGDASLAEMNDATEVSPDDPVELTTGNAPAFVDDGEVGIVPELEQEPEWDENEVADEESELAGSFECD